MVDKEADNINLGLMSAIEAILPGIFPPDDFHLHVETDLIVGAIYVDLNDWDYNCDTGLYVRIELHGANLTLAVERDNRGEYNILYENMIDIGDPRFCEEFLMNRLNEALAAIRKWAAENY